MGMKQYYYVVLGTVIPEDNFPGDPWDERWLPYYEGHEGTEFSILQGGEGSRNIYVGKVLAEADPYEDFEYKRFWPDRRTSDQVEAWIKENFGYGPPAKLMLVCRWA